MHASVSAHTLLSPVTGGVGNGWPSGDREAESGEGARGLLSYPEGSTTCNHRDANVLSHRIKNTQDRQKERHTHREEGTLFGKLGKEQRKLRDQCGDHTIPKLSSALPAMPT